MQEEKPSGEKTHLMAVSRKHGRKMQKQFQQQKKAVLRKIHQMILDKERDRAEKEAKQVQKRVELLRSVQDGGGPCFTSVDVDNLLRRLRGKSKTAKQEAIKNQIHYQKTILRRPGTLKVAGTLEAMIAALKLHLDDGQAHVRDEDIGEAAADIPLQAADDEEDQHDQEDELDDGQQGEPFSFSHQGQLVAVYHDDTFYIGEVETIIVSTNAQVQYMHPTCRRFFFRWPQVSDFAETSGEYVFRWDFPMKAAPGSLWEVDDIDSIMSGYQMIRRRSQNQK